MLLHSLLRQFAPQLPLSNIPNPEIPGVREDSRLVQRGDLFVARAGTKADGQKFIHDAIARGAAAVVCADKVDGATVPVINVKDPGAAASKLANLLHGNPGQMVKVLAVTGTNGKTTTTYLIRHLLAKANRKCGLIGTVETDDGSARREAEMTTPSACDVAKLLADMRDNACSACAIETSSHALDQGRVAGVPFAGAAFTNLTGDHLDYHKTMDAYADAKAKLFASLDDSGVAVVNGDDAWSERMVKKTSARVVRFGFDHRAEYSARDWAVTSQGSDFVLHTPDGRAEVHMGLIGKHNVENGLAAAALVSETFGLSVNQIAAGLRDAQGAPGRLQAVRAGQPFAVLVDYAHTDDALENVLSALRPLTRGKLRVVFGCGGDRDRTKRPRMARTAENLAHALYVTSDNPRTEEPTSILDQIVEGLTEAGRAKTRVNVDRRAAIRQAIEDAREGDVVLIAGKGHENYQVLGTTKHHFDDVEEATAAITSGTGFQPVSSSAAH
jgi:UDP-N-acetylmuramoyl-L-alanyl-D-glutamate--2,6-diaminopimelate ligase